MMNNSSDILNALNTKSDTQPGEPVRSDDDTNKGYTVIGTENVNVMEDKNPIQQKAYEQADRTLIQETKNTKMSNKFNELLEKINAEMVKEYQKASSESVISFADQAQRIGAIYSVTQDIYSFLNGNNDVVYQLPMRPLECTHIWEARYDPNAANTMRVLYEGDANPDIGDTIGFDANIIRIEAGIDTTTVVLTDTQRNRWSMYTGDHRDTTTIFRSVNWGMDGPAMMRYIGHMMQTGNAALNCSTQSLWLKFWLYVRAAIDIPATGTHWDGCFFTNLITNWEGTRWPRAQGPNDYFPKSAMPGGQKVRVGLDSVFLTFNNYVNWLMGLTRVVGNGARDWKPSDVGNGLFIVPLTDMSMSPSELYLYTLAHLPFPFGCTDDSGVAYTLASAETLYPMAFNYPVTHNAWLCVTTDGVPTIYNGGLRYLVMYVYQPVGGNSIAGLTAGGSVISDLNVVGIFGDLGAEIDAAWRLLPDGITGAMNMLTKHYGQGRTCQEMYELAVGLTFWMPSPKWSVFNSTARAHIGNACYNPNPSGWAYGDRQFYRSQAERVGLIRQAMNCLGACPCHVPYPTYFENRRSAVTINVQNPHALLGLAFNFFMWEQDDMRVRCDISPLDAVLPHKIALLLACRYQAAQGNISIAERWPYNIWPDVNVESYRRKAVAGTPGALDGSMRARVEKAYGGRIRLNYLTGYDLYGDWDTFWGRTDNGGPDPCPVPYSGWSLIPLWVPIWKWLEIIGVDPQVTRTDNVWKTDINKWIEERKPLLGMNTACPVLKNLPDYWEKDWGEVWKDLWYRMDNNAGQSSFIYIRGKNTMLRTFVSFPSADRTIGRKIALWFTSLGMAVPNWTINVPEDPITLPLIQPKYEMYNQQIVRVGLLGAFRDNVGLQTYSLRMPYGIGFQTLENNMNETDLNELIYN